MHKQSLIAFEEEIARLFMDRKIMAPIHLTKNNEEQLIEIFRRIKKEDWVFSTHRSHYHALLHGIDPEWLKGEIVEGRSLHIFNEERNFFTSSVVAGCLPIAIGVANAIKMKGEKRRVWCFIGDMAAETGAFHEGTKYARNHDLPISFIIEDNGFSTNTPTAEVWGIKGGPRRGGIVTLEKWGNGEVMKYCYERGYPHTGCGVWVKF